LPVEHGVPNSTIVFRFQMKRKGVPFAFQMKVGKKMFLLKNPSPKQ